MAEAESTTADDSTLSLFQRRRQQSQSQSEDASVNSSEVTSVSVATDEISSLFGGKNPENANVKSFNTENAGVLDQSLVDWHIKKRRKRRNRTQQPLSDDNSNNQVLNDFTLHSGLRWYERLYDECAYRFHEALHPLKDWKWRHFLSLYVLQRFFMRPVMYAPGILAFYHWQIGRRLTPIIQKHLSEKSLLRFVGPAFWDSGFMQGWMRTPLKSQRYREACADFAVLLGVTWPVWYWVRLYYGYYIIEWIRWRVELDPSLAIERLHIETALDAESQRLSALAQ